MIITRNGRDVAELRPIVTKPTPEQAVAELKAWRIENGVKATADEITAWIRESRDSH